VAVAKHTKFMAGSDPDHHWCGGVLLQATAALEWGAMPYAKGVIDNHFTYYVRADGMGWSRATELPAAARALTVLALYHSYSGKQADTALLVKHFGKVSVL